MPDDQVSPRRSLPNSLCDRPFQTFVLSGLDPKDWGKRFRFGPSQDWSLFQLLEGSATSGAKWSALTDKHGPGTVLLQQPGGDRHLQFPRACRFRRIIFSVVWSDRLHAERTKYSVPHGSQPRATELFGFDLPFIIDGALAASGCRVVQECSSIWWRGVLDRHQAGHVLHGWLLDLLRQVCTAPDTSANDLRARLSLLVHHRLKHGISVADLAASAGVSPRTLHRQLQTEHGISPGQLIDEVRLDAARGLLRKMDTTVARVATLCGFPHAGAFTRWFRTQTGETPSAMRKNLVNLPRQGRTKADFY